MKWRNSHGNRKDMIEQKKHSIGVERKFFAWWPTWIGFSGDTVWLQTYYKMYYLNSKDYRDTNIYEMVYIEKGNPHAS